MIGCGASTRAGDEPCVFAENSVAIARLRFGPPRTTTLQFGLIHVQLKQQLVGIDGDAVAFLNQTDGSSDGGLRSNVAHNEAVGATAEAPIGDQSDLVPKALSHDR